MLCCFGGGEEEVKKPRASTYAAKEDAETASAREPTQLTAIAEVTRKEVRTTL